MFHKSVSGYSTAFFHKEDIFFMKKKYFGMIKKSAIEDPRGRARICLHQNHNDTIQEMVIAMRKSSYIRPHKHKDRSESFQVLEGKMHMVTFDDIGKVLKKEIMAPFGHNLPFICRLVPGVWHTIISITKIVVYYEIFQGPFIGDRSEFAAFAPAENGAQDKIKSYLLGLIKS